ncbi:MAG: type II secretion system F family protein [Planctomycetales bacterium]|nr:type II secretion system F family protein [Planctomycetales bacterium]
MPQIIESPAQTSTRDKSSSVPTFESASVPTRGLQSARPVKISRRELALLTTQLAIMTRAGLDVASSLKSLAQQMTRPAIKDVVAHIHADVLGGKSFSRSLAVYERSFGAPYVATVAAGEVAGRLGTVLAHLSASIRKEIKLRSSVISMLIYPACLVMVATGVILGLLVFVLPTFAEVFGQFGASIPPLTQFILGFGLALRTWVWIWMPLALIAAIAVVLFFRSSRGKQLWDHVLLQAPVMRRVGRPFYAGRVCRLFGMMLNSGVPLLDTIRLARSAISSPAYSNLLLHVEDQVLSGQGAAHVFAEYGFVPSSVAEMLNTAEQTGSMAEITGLLAEHFEEESESRLRELISTLEPVVTVAMGVVVAAIVLAVMVPLFDLYTLAGNGPPGQ